MCRGYNPFVLRSDLFNSKTIKRLCNDVEICSDQEQATEEWLKLLNTNNLKSEKKNYLRFATIILDRILGYPIMELAFETDNVEFQFKNEDGKKILCFETKGTATEDLFASQHRGKNEHGTPIKQTWDYMGRIDLDYGICTNYRYFVLITKQYGYSKYHLFDFASIEKNREKLREFIGIFSKERIINRGFVQKLQEESVVEEREFTKEFYKLYHETRLMMIKMFGDDENVSRNEAVYYTQLFLNRLIFIFFVEDKGFIPDSQIFTKRILHLLKSGQFTEHSRKIYDDIKELFISFDKGSQVLGIVGFNGSLFSGTMPAKIYFTDLKDDKFFSDVKQNSKLNKLQQLNTTAANIVKRHSDLNTIISNLLIMDSFDFKTEVNVNILGHIFEQSISDLENLKYDGTSKRKKEGVYYTPEYITDYICRNTIIPYLSKSGTTSIPDLVEEYKDNMDELEKKFKEMKILDPACGSGAFLIKAIEILLEINKVIQDLKGPMKHSSGQLPITYKWNESEEVRSIIENNIYGIDINPESVDITRLSLFLKLASGERKLIGLSKHIKVGNSLIDDKSIDNRAFSWEAEFPEILNTATGNNGFDIIIGNPPYVRQEQFKEIKPHLQQKFKSYNSLADLYVYFVEKGIELLSDKGFMSFIIPNKFLKTKYGKNLRIFLKNSARISKIYDFDDYPVFEDATTYPLIIILKKKGQFSLKYSKLLNRKTPNPLDNMKYTEQTISQNNLDSSSWIFVDKNIDSIVRKMQSGGTELKRFVDNKIFRGISTGKNGVFIVNKDLYEELAKDVNTRSVLKKVVTGSEIKRYRINFQGQYLLFIPWDYDIDSSQHIKNYLLRNKSKLDERPEVKKKKFNWWCLSRYGSKNAKYLSESKIIYPRITNKSNFYMDQTGELYLSDNNFFISTNSKSLLAILNSSLIFFYLKQICPTLQGGFYDFRRPYIEKIPIHNNIKKFDSILSENASALLSLNRTKIEEEQMFWNSVFRRFSIDKINKKLEDVFSFSFNEFLEEIQKLSKTKLSLDEQEEWNKYFEKRQNLVLNLKNNISKLDAKINSLVYQMYDLTNDEIEIVEHATKL